ncbi:MAG: PAS domain-containing protein [Phycisphaerae bacterium]|nr:PAS domain-containing protein [Phycisphaerae bacterium]
MGLSEDQDTRFKPHSPGTPETSQGNHVDCQDLYKELPVGFVILERSGKIRYCNPLASSLLGMKQATLSDQLLPDFVDPSEKGHLFLHIFEVCQTGQPAHCEVKFAYRGKTARHAELRSIAVPDPKRPSKTLCHTAILDMGTRHSQVENLLAHIQESKRRIEQSTADLARSSSMLLQETQELEDIEARLDRTNALFDKVFDTSYLAIAMLDLKLNFIRVNHAFARGMQQSQNYSHGKNYFSLFPDDEARVLFDQVLDTGEPLIEFARPFVHGEGKSQQRSWWDWTVSLVSDAQGHPDGLLLCMTNVTQRVELERQLMQITDREQKRLGRELHDGMAQLLTAISLKTKVLEQTVAQKMPESLTTIRDIAELLREATIQTRDLSRLLNPTVVEAEGLIPALEALCQETMRRMNVTCELHCEDSMPSFTPAVAGHLYRIAQESITNAIRHGQAKHICIELFIEKNRRVLQISNDGTPFSLTALKTTQGLGTKGMQYRAEVIGANFTIEPDAHGRTIMRCELARAITLPSTE